MLLRLKALEHAFEFTNCTSNLIKDNAAVLLSEAENINWLDGFTKMQDLPEEDVHKQRVKILEKFLKSDRCNRQYAATAKWKNDNGHVFIYEWTCPNQTSLVRKGRQLELLSLIAVGGLIGGFIGTGLGIYNTIELNKLKAQGEDLSNYIHSLEGFLK